MATAIKRLLVGTPKRTEQMAHERLSKKTALAVFSSDALSSVAYSTEAILLVFVGAGALALTGYLVPIIIGLVFLLAILALSYRQTIHAYPSGGGAYIVAKDNLGTLPGLVAGASLLVDYILTVAVSVSAGVAAITSAANGTRFEFLQNHRVTLCLILIALIAIVNLRGVRESGAIFAGPTYLFIFAMLVLIVGGFHQYFTTGATMPPPENLHLASPTPTFAHAAVTGGLTWLLLRAFAAGCTALTGVEAISNGVPAFKQPEAKNSAATLTWMVIVMTTLILGTGMLAYKLHALPNPQGEETLVSMMTRHTFGSGALYYYVQATTAAILVLAANTSFADFPRLSSLMAADRYLPRQLANRGDRLVFSNGIILLAFFASLLVVIFKGSEQAMLPLYALGVFTSFTLSQAGMVVHWLRERRAEESKASILREERTEDIHATVDPGRATHARERIAALDSHRGGNWLTSILINGLGALITFVVGIVIAVTKFTHGAWAVVIVIGLLILLFRAVHGHYVAVSQELTLTGASPLPPASRHRIIVPVSGVHRGVLPALRYAKSLCGEGTDVSAVYVETNPEHTDEMRRQWGRWGQGIALVVLESPYRSITGPLIRYIHEEASADQSAMTTVVLPEFIPRTWWQHLMHNQTSLLIKGRLLFDPNVIVTSVPYHLRH